MLPDKAFIKKCQNWLFRLPIKDKYILLALMLGVLPVWSSVGINALPAVIAVEDSITELKCTELKAINDINGDGVADNDGGNGHRFTYLTGENTIEFYPEKKRSSKEQPLYFYIKITGYEASQNLKVKIMWFLRMKDGSTWAPIYARWSYDQEKWNNTMPKKEVFVDGKGIPEYVIPKEKLTGDTIYFAHGYIRPYHKWLEYIDSLNAVYPDYFKSTELCKSNEHSLSVKLLKITDPVVPDSMKKAVWIISRQHAFEVQNDVVMQGFLDHVLQSDDQDIAQLRKNAIIYLVPLMDADAAYSGTPGKMPDSPDFNRVWNDSPSQWNAVQAVKDSALAIMQRNDLEVFLDFHNPYPSQNRLEILHMFPKGDARIPLNSFSNFFNNHQQDRLHLRINPKGYNSVNRVLAGGWAHRSLSPRICGTLEIGWDKDEYGNTFNRNGYMSAGASFAAAIAGCINSFCRKYRVSVTVKDEITGEPLPKAHLWFNGKELLTDSAGSAVFDSIAYGTHTLIINKNGYQQMQQSDIFIKTSESLEFIMKKDLPDIEFLVIDKSTSEPVNRAYIQASGSNASTSADGMGIVKNISSEKVIYRITHNDFFTFTDSVTISNDTSLSVALTKKYADVGFQVSYEGEPLTGIQVQFGTRTAETTMEGEVNFINIQARQHYIFSIQDEEYEPVTDTFFLDTDTIISVSLTKKEVSGSKSTHLSKVNVFPNPASKSIFIQFTSKGKGCIFEIFDSNGKLIKAAAVEKIHPDLEEVNVSSLRNGIYTLVVLCGNNRKSLQFSVIR